MSFDTDRLAKMADDAAAVLCEHCDSVQIIVTYRDGKEAGAFGRGAGNWFARYGSVVDWVDRQKADSQVSIEIAKKRDELQE